MTIGRERWKLRYRWPRQLQGRGLLTIILLTMFIWSLLQVDWRDDLVHAGGVGILLDMAGGLLRPELSMSTLRTAIGAAGVTIAYAVAGMSLALALAIPLALFASGVLCRRRASRQTSIASGRAVLSAMRSVHELVWALLFVTAIGLTPFAAIFALAIPYAGILGRVYADLLNDTPEAPLHALSVSGASRFQILVYGRLPMAAPDLISYTFYRLECALRSSAIMSFVGLGGLGYQIQLALADLRYGQVSVYLGALIAIVMVTDAWSSEVRRRMVR